MKSFVTTIIAIMGSAFIIMTATSCSDDSGFIMPLSKSNSIVGVAAIGNPIIGTVYVKDSVGATLTTQTDSNGNFSVSVEYMTEPFIIMVEGKEKGYGPDIRLYSYIGSTGRANITPVTNALVALAVSGVPDAVIDPDDMKASGTVITLPADFQERLEEAQSAFNLILDPVVKNGFDLISGKFAADGTGFDKLLDTLYVNVNESTDSVTFGLRDQVMDTAAIPLDADLSDPAIYQGAVEAIDDSSDFINDPEFRARYMAMFSGPGADGIWFTDDDQCSGVMEMTDYPSGRSHIFYSHNGPGPDGDYVPTASNPDAFDDNVREILVEYPDEDNPVIVIGGISYQMFTETGVSGNIRWSRSVQYVVTDPLNPVPTSYTISEADAETGKSISFMFSKFNADPRGADGILFTDDDPIEMYAATDEEHNVSIAYSDPGADGIWTTVEDNEISAYYPDMVVQNGTSYNNYIYDKGPDGLWFTEDDTISTRMAIYFEPVM